MTSGHFDNEISLAGSEGLEGLKVCNIKPQKIVPSSVGHSAFVPASGQIAQLARQRIHVRQFPEAVV